MSPAVQLLYGSRYGQIDAATRWLVIGEAMHFVTISRFITLQASGRNRGYPAVVFGALVANVLVNLVVIPRCDYLGAAVVTVEREAVAGGLLLLVGLAYVLGLHPGAGGRAGRPAGAAAGRPPQQRPVRLIGRTGVTVARVGSAT